MRSLQPEPTDAGGRLADNIAIFARTLRSAGLRVGPAAILTAIDAVRIAGFSTRADFYWTLHACLVSRHEDGPVFQATFDLFWRAHEFDARMIALLAPRAPPRESEAKPPKAGETRARDAVNEGARREAPVRKKPEIEIDAQLTTAANEILRRKDFAQMTAAELDEARRAIKGLALPRDEVVSRRLRADPRGTVFDARRTIARSMRSGGDLLVPRFRKRRCVRPPLVVLADISGSMSQYSRMMLFFLHALAENRRGLHVFLFGTRLTNVSRHLKRRDPDTALAECTSAVKDWSGGTRIGETLARFNRVWARRVLGGRARVLLITDGLELGDTALLAKELDRLHRSCERLTWLNPLLRYDGFSPKARGVRAMLPHVDEFRSVHSLEAIADLCRALSSPPDRQAQPRRWLAEAA